MNKKLLTIPFFISLLVLALFAYHPTSNITVGAVDGVEDSYGNKIWAVVIYQYIDGDWETVSSIYDNYWGTAADNYTTGMLISLTPNVATSFGLHYDLNSTLAGSTAEAVTRTSINCTIAGETLVLDFGPTASYSAEEGLYHINAIYDWNDGPEPASSYVLTVQYQVLIVE